MNTQKQKNKYFSHQHSRDFSELSKVLHTNRNNIKGTEIFHGQFVFADWKCVVVRNFLW